MQRIISITLLLFPLFAAAQVRHTVSGTVRDSASGETLIGASLVLLEQPRSAVLSNSFGFYSINAPAGHYKLVVSFAGYRTDTLVVVLDRDVLLGLQLNSATSQLQEVVVSANRNDANVSKPLMGVQKLSVTEIRDIPVIFGEKDILKTIQLLPGVQSAGDGNSGFYVRGGSIDQNLILLDGATVYDPSHLLGFFSVFNSDAIKDVTLYKGAIPAEYGGRLSSVLDVKMNDGNSKDYSASGGIGLIDSRLTIEGPIQKDDGSFIVSARRTYADIFLKLSKDTNTNRNSLYFYDLNAKANYKLGDKDHLYLSGYFGQDHLGISNSFDLSYGNATGTLRWNHILNSKLFSNTSLIYSKYDYTIGITSGNNDIGIKSFIQDFDLKEDLEYYISSGNKLNVGFDVVDHTISPGNISASQSSSFNALNIQNRHALESAIYLNHDIAISDKLNMNYGLRAEIFTVLGPGTFYTYDSAGNTIDSAKYGSGQTVINYFNLEPRWSASYKVSDNSSVKASYSRTTQNLHLLSNSTSSNPTDVWIPSSNNVKPEIGDQVSLGYYRNLKENTYELSAEVYYRSMQNQIDYKNGAQLIANSNVESQLVFGHGRAYGLELYARKKVGRLTGWISYTLSRTERQFAAINNDSWYPATQDRTHDLSVVGIYKLNKKWTLSSDFVYYTGNATTWPSGKYQVDGQIAFVYTQRNGYRMPPYNRLDFSATLQGRKTKKTDSYWIFSCYNVYGRENPYSISFEQDPGDPNKTQAVQYALFRWVPSISYNFKF
jgi:TonB dependent receptor/CarboxypepD_reg-like domain/TonB-dependent Receptor Plug Domain